MPPETDSESEMDSMYGDASDSPKTTDTQDAPESVDDEEKEESQETGLVSNKVLSGPDGKAPKPGDICRIKIVKNFGDESSFVWAGGDDEKPSVKSPYADDMAGDKELSDMSEES